MPRPEPLDPVKLAQTVAQLQALPAPVFADVLSDNLKDSADLAALGDREAPDDLPTPQEVRYLEEAFRSDELAFQTRAALRAMIDSVNAQLNDRTKTAQQRRAAINFRNRVGYERRILDAVCAGIQARTGVLPNQPNPRQRAFEALAKRYPVEYLEILREKEAEAAERIRQQKEERKAAAQRRKREGRSPQRPSA
jgi:hypothetical protein